MNHLHLVVILATAYLVVFFQTAFPVFRHFTGVQVDLLPSLMVYVGLSCPISTVTLTAVTGGLGFDAVSANPLGVSILPLFATGLVIHQARGVVMKDQRYAQWVLGLMASAGAPVMTLGLILLAGMNPLMGWGTLWQISLMAAAGAAMAPLWFCWFGLFHRFFEYQPLGGTSFRADREIKRGRN